MSEQSQQAPHEKLMGELLDELMQRVSRDEPLDLTALEQQHPDLADQIRNLLPTVRAMHDLGLPSSPRSAEVASAKVEQVAQLGDFGIIRELGRGGMGVVYEAQQLSLQRIVALKILPFAAVLDQRQLARFKNEALAAAQLDHPNIVDVFGVGCERGVHYYAMRCIRGQTLAEIIQHLRHSTKHAATEPASGKLPETAEYAPTVISESAPKPTASSAQSVRDTASLAVLSTYASSASREYFQTIAALIRDAARALDYAHERGVVHRDIKPGNLMVDGDGKLWVTDFGLAHIEGDVSLTMSGDLLGTLRYMSPEQALAKRVVIDHRTDIYSLGATFYELLTLQPVFDGSDRQSLLKQIAFEDPTPPRQIRRQIPTDLETIVLTAIAKNPHERYETASDLADDLQRFLDIQPIKARRPTVRQRLAKFAYRHTSLVASTLAILLVCTVAFAIATLLIAREQSQTLAALTESQANFDEAQRQEQEAQRQQMRAEENFQRARDVVDTYLTRVSEEQLLEAPGMQPLRKDLLDLALKYYQEFIEQRADDPQLRAKLADAYHRMGGISITIGSTDEALQSYQAAVTLNESLQAEQPSTNQLGRLVEGYLGQAEAHEQLKQWEEALALQQKAVDISVALDKQHPDEPKSQSLLGRSCLSLAGTRWHMGERQEAVALYEQAITIFEKLAQDDPDNSKDLGHLALAYQDLGLAQARLGEYSAMQASYRKAIEIYEELTERHPAVQSYRASLSNVCHNFASSSIASDEESLALFNKAMVIRESLVAQNASVPDYKLRLASTYNNLFNKLMWMGETEEALALSEKVIDVLKKWVETEPDNLDLKSQLVGFYVHLGNQQDDPGESLVWYDLATVAAEELIAQDPSNRHYPSGFANILVNIANTHKALGHVDAAIATWRELIDFRERYVEDDTVVIASSCVELAKLLKAAGEPEEAVAYEGKAVTHFEAALQRDPENVVALNDLAGVLLSDSEAVRDVERAVELAERAVELRPQDLPVWGRLGAAQLRSGQYESAVESLTKFIELSGGIDNFSSPAWIYLALAHWQLEQHDRAREYYQQAVDWMQGQNSANENLVRLRSEAEELMGIVTEQVTTTDREGASSEPKRLTHADRRPPAPPLPQLIMNE